jgi:hypothetical protein
MPPKHGAGEPIRQHVVVRILAGDINMDAVKACGGSLVRTVTATHPQIEMSIHSLGIGLSTDQIFLSQRYTFGHWKHRVRSSVGKIRTCQDIRRRVFETNVFWDRYIIAQAIDTQNY